MICLQNRIFTLKVSICQRNKWGMNYFPFFMSVWVVLDYSSHYKHIEGCRVTLVWSGYCKRSLNLTQRRGLQTRNIDLNRLNRYCHIVFGHPLDTGQFIWPNHGWIIEQVNKTHTVMVIFPQSFFFCLCALLGHKCLALENEQGEEVQTNFPRGSCKRQFVL